MRARLWLLVLVFQCATTLLGAATLEGVVVQDRDGAPVVSAEVRISRQGSARLVAHLETDREGHFRLEPMPVGPHVMRVSRPGFLDTEISISADHPNLVIRLIRAARISGTVRDASGEPLPRATVFVLQKSSAGTIQEIDRQNFRTLTRPDGSFQLRNLPPGNYLLATSHQRDGVSGALLYPNNTSPRLFEVKGGEEFPNCDFYADVAARFTIRGRIAATSHVAPSAPDGEAEPSRQKRPADSYSIGIATAANPEILVTWTQTDAGGAFTLTAIPEGDYIVFGAGPIQGVSFKGGILAKNSRLLYGRTTLSVAGDVADFEVPLRAPHSVSLLIAKQTLDRSCSGSMALSLTSLEAWGTILRHNISISPGVATLVEDLAPTRYVVESVPSDPCQVHATEVLDLRESIRAEPLPIRVLRKGSLLGRLLEGQMDQQRYQVVLVPLGPAAGEAITVADVASDGAFHFRNLRPGRYGVAARVHGDATAQLVAATVSLIEIEILGGEVQMSLHAPAGPPTGKGNE